MAYSLVSYTADGSSQVFSVPFPYLDRLHVRVRVDGVDVVRPAQWDWTGDTQISFRHAPPAGAGITIYRLTPRDSRLVDFTSGSVLTEADLDRAHTQHLYISQEIIEQIEAGLVGALTTGGTWGPGESPQERIDNLVDEVLQSALLADLQARIGDIDLNAEGISQEVIDRQADISALDVRLVGAEGATTANAAALSVLDTTLIDLDGRLTSAAQDITTLEASVNDPTSGLSATGSALSALTTRVTSAEGTITSQASSLTAVQTEVDGNTASAAALATSVDGLEAQYSIKVDANGRVAGIGLSSGSPTSPTSSVVVLADKFAVVDPANPGGTAKVPFVVSGGTVYMQNVVVGDAQIQNLTVGKLTSGVLNAAVTANNSYVLTTGGSIYTNGKAGIFDTTEGVFIGYDPARSGYGIGIGTSSQGLRYDPLANKLDILGDVVVTGNLKADAISDPPVSYTLATAIAAYGWKTVLIDNGHYFEAGDKVTVTVQLVTQGQSSGPPLVGLRVVGHRTTGSIFYTPELDQTMVEWDATGGLDSTRLDQSVYPMTWTFDIPHTDSSWKFGLLMQVDAASRVKKGTSIIVQRIKR